jgi:hypothetical protein
LHIKRIPRFRWVDENLIEFEHLSALYQMHIESKELSLENNWPNEALDKAFSVNNDVAFTLGQIYICQEKEF